MLHMIHRRKTLYRILLFEMMFLIIGDRIRYRVIERRHKIEKNDRRVFIAKIFEIKSWGYGIHKKHTLLLWIV